MVVLLIPDEFWPISREKLKARIINRNISINRVRSFFNPIFTAEARRTQRNFCFCFSLRGRKTKRAILPEGHRFSLCVLCGFAVRFLFIRLPLFIE